MGSASALFPRRDGRPDRRGHRRSRTREQPVRRSGGRDDPRSPRRTRDGAGTRWPRPSPPPAGRWTHRRPGNRDDRAVSAIPGRHRGPVARRDRHRAKPAGCPRPRLTRSPCLPSPCPAPRRSPRWLRTSPPPVGQRRPDRPADRPDDRLRGGDPPGATAGELREAIASAGRAAGLSQEQIDLLTVSAWNVPGSANIPALQQALIGATMDAGLTTSQMDTLAGAVAGIPPGRP